MKGTARKMTRIAIMQPYFVPYAGYFRLFSEADLFVIYDCVQFPRRGYVHRNQLPDAMDRPRWFTLPLKYASRTAKIKDMEFADDGHERLALARRNFPCLRSLPEVWENLFSSAAGPLVPWLTASLDLTCQSLNIESQIIRSSELEIPDGYTGQDRIIQICKTLGATSYLNAPGGRHLYSEKAFQEEKIELSFLPPYQGATLSVLFDLLHSDAPDHAGAAPQNGYDTRKGNA